MPGRPTKGFFWKYLLNCWKHTWETSGGNLKMISRKNSLRNLWWDFWKPVKEYLKECLKKILAEFSAETADAGILRKKSFNSLLRDPFGIKWKVEENLNIPLMAISRFLGNSTRKVFWDFSANSFSDSIRDSGNAKFHWEFSPKFLSKYTRKKWKFLYTTFFGCFPYLLYWFI